MKTLVREAQKITTKNSNGESVPADQIALNMVLLGREWAKYKHYTNNVIEPFETANISAFNMCVIYDALEDVINEMDEITRQSVFAEIEKIKEKASQVIQGPNIPDTDMSRDLLRACNLINFVKTNNEIKNAIQTKQQADEGVTM